VDQLKTLVEITRSIERSIRSLEDVARQPAAAQHSGPWLDTIQQYRAAAYHQAALATTAASMGSVPQQLEQHAAHIAQRLQAAVDWAHRTLAQLIASNLQQCGWPPPVGRQAGEGQQQQRPQQQQEQLEVAWGDQPEPLAALQHLLLALTALQQAQQQAQFDALAAAAAGEGAALAAMSAPLLWAAEALAAPLQEKLEAMFANGTALGALDRPEWLLDTVVRVAQEQCPGLVVFQASCLPGLPCLPWLLWLLGCLGCLSRRRAPDAGCVCVWGGCCYGIAGLPVGMAGDAAGCAACPLPACCLAARSVQHPAKL
jgi:hypothetical protein